MISPAGVTSNPNVANVRKGVRIQRFVILFSPGKEYREQMVNGGFDCVSKQ